VPGQHDKVGVQRPDGRVIPAGTAPQLNEHILHHVLRPGLVPQDAERRTVNRRRQVVKELAKGAVVPGYQTRRKQRITAPHVLDANAAPVKQAMSRRGSSRPVTSEPAGTAVTYY